MKIADIMVHLERIRVFCFQNGENLLNIPYEGEWQLKDLETAVSEAQDILFDYEKQGEQLKKMIKHYETTGRPKKDHRLGIYLCPSCNGRVNFHQGYCQKCGKRLNAERTRYDTRKAH